MTRLPLALLEKGARVLDQKASRYLARVRRLTAGATFEVFDPATGLEADAKIVAVRSASEVTIELGESRAARKVAERVVRLVQCVGKGNKLDAVVRDATELGVTHIQPAISQRTVKEAGASQRARLERVALDASRQCGRSDVPRVDEPCGLEDALRASEATHKLCLHPRARASFRQELASIAATDSIDLVIGPEGGFTDGELQLAEALGYRLVRLGVWTMRTETAATAALGALLVSASPDVTAE